MTDPSTTDTTDLEVTAASYDEAADELDELLVKIEEPGLDLDELAGHVRRAGALLAWCRARLDTIDADVRDALADVGDET